MSKFYQVSPSDESLWRAIILFGRNVASYKFGLGKALLELCSTEKTFVSLEDLAEPFSRHVCDHLRQADKQGTFKSSKFLDACRRFNNGEIDKTALLSTTVKLGFNNVIDAFHIVGRGEIPKRFFIDDRAGKNGITITDDFLALKESPQFQNLPCEVEARWRLVETAWNLKLAPRLLQVRHDPDMGLLYIERDDARRTDITSAREALNGYQKGKCFYCFTDVTIDQCSDSSCDVDHFFPHVLQREGVVKPVLDGMWNLVLACYNCNRGPGGKFDRVPALQYLERLCARNDFLIDSHHPLRETLIEQTGRTPEQRKEFLQRQYNVAIPHLIHTWAPKDELEPAF